MIGQIAADPLDPYIVDSGIVKDHLRDVLRWDISAVPYSAVCPECILYIQEAIILISAPISTNI